MLSQLKALIALRLLLLRRSWARSAAGLVAGLVITIMTLGIVLFALVLGCGLFFAGWYGFAEAPPILLLIVMDAMVVAVLVVWTVGILTELQRSDVVDFRRMLYLPVSLRMVFLLNFAVSLVTPLFPLFMAAVVGWSLGLGLAVGPQMLWIIVLAVAFYLMLAAWTYHLRGVLSKLLENKRKRQFFAMLAMLFFVTLSQLPNLFLQISRHRIQSNGSVVTNENPPEAVQWLIDVHDGKDNAQNSPLGSYNAVLPPGWLPLGATALATGHYGVAALCFVGMTALGGAGLAAGYRSTYRHYTGTTRRRKKASPAARKTAGTPREPLTSRSLPFANADTSALTFASFLAAVRHPRVRVMSIMPTVIGVVLLTPALLGYMPRQSASFMIAIVCYMVFMNAGVFLFNLFGHDAEGFQALILLPTPRHKYLLGRNLAFFPFMGVQAVLFSTLGVFAFGLHPVTYLVLLLQIVQAYLSLCMAGNLVSMYLPYRLQKDSMRANSAKPAAFLAAFISLFGIPVLLLPSVIAVAADLLVRGFLHMPYLPAGLILSLVFLAFTAGVYYLSLPPVGRLLLAREQRILVALQKDRD